METKTVPFEVKDLSEDNDNYVFNGLLAAYENVDYGLDRIKKGAFKNFLTKSRATGVKSIPSFWSHDERVPIGVLPVKDMRETDEGLFVHGIMPKDDSFVKGRIMPQMRVGSIGQMSIGYDAIDFKYDGKIRDLYDLHLWEGSLVSIAMNNKATIRDFKSVPPYQDLPLADRQRAWDNDSAIGRVREWAGADDGSLSDPDVQKKYKQAFFWYDDANQDLFGAYKLPFADIIDGRLTAVPRGVFAAAAAMRGARGGVYLPEQDRPGVIRNIERYYAKMELDSPFTKSNVIKLHDLTCIDERTLEHIFKSGVSFTGKLAPAVVSALKSCGLRDVVDEGTRDADYKAIDDKLTAMLQRLNGGN